MTCGCTHAAIESTSDYWNPVFNILEGMREVVLVNAQHVKPVPGHRTDVNGPRGAIRSRHMRAELGGDVCRMSRPILRSMMQASHTAWRPPLHGPRSKDRIATAVFYERHVGRLVDIPHPMAEVFQRREPVHLRRTGLRQDPKIRIHRRHHPGVVEGTRVIADLCVGAQ